MKWINECASKSTLQDLNIKNNNVDEFLFDKIKLKLIAQKSLLDNTSERLIFLKSDSHLPKKVALFVSLKAL